MVLVLSGIFKFFFFFFFLNLNYFTYLFTFILFKSFDFVVVFAFYLNGSLELWFLMGFCLVRHSIYYICMFCFLFVCISSFTFDYSWSPIRLCKSSLWAKLLDNTAIFCFLLCFDVAYFFSFHLQHNQCYAFHTHSIRKWYQMLGLMTN